MRVSDENQSCTVRERLQLFKSILELIQCLTFCPIVQTVPWTLRYDEYKDHLVDQAALMLHLFGHLAQTKQILATQFHFRLRTPDLVISVS